MLNRVLQVVVMGVSGCGKSTVGRLLAQRLGVAYVEGDELHPRENVERMAAGIALTDEDRAGWLDRVAQALADGSERGVVVTCSALKRSYRDRLRAGAQQTRFVHLTGPREMLMDRMSQRKGHYMPAALLQSQLDILEPPSGDEAALELGIDTPATAQAERAYAWLTKTA